MNAYGSGQQILTRNPARDGHPVWSPDGRQIAFERVVGGVGNNENTEIYVMNADGSDQRRLTSNPTFDGSPVWSPVSGDSVPAPRSSPRGVWYSSRSAYP